MKRLLLALAFLSTLQFSKAPRQGIQGQVFWLSGNQMPGPGKVSNPQLGVAREIQIYQAVFIGDVEQQDQFYKTIDGKLVTTLQTKPDGTFKVKLPVGKYSIFTKEPKGLFANIIDQNGCVSCVTVNPKRYAWVSFTVDYEAAY